MEELYECGETLASTADKSEKEAEYLRIIRAAAASGPSNAKLFAAQQLPRFFKYFPGLSAEGINAQLDLCEDDDLNIRITAIRGLPFLCKDTPQHLPKIADVLAQLLIGEEQEHAVVVNSLMQVLRQNPKECLSAVFKHVESSEEKLREKVLAFIRDKIYPNRKALLVPQAEMERHVADLIKGIQDVTGDEFRLLMEFVQGLALFGEGAPPERMQELVEIVEGQADLDSRLDVSDSDHLERVMACLHMALPFLKRGGSNSKFFLFIANNMLPSFGKIPDKRKTDLLKCVAEASPQTASAVSRVFLPPLVALLKECISKEKGTELNATHIEALLYTFHQLASKTPNATNALCGFKIVTGQPSDRLGEDFRAAHEEWLERLSSAMEEAKKKSKAALAEAQETERKIKGTKGEQVQGLRAQQEAAAQTVRACSNIDKLTKGLRSSTPSFLSAAAAPTLSWVPQPSAASGTSSASPSALKGGGAASQSSATAQQKRGHSLGPASGSAATDPAAKRPKKEEMQPKKQQQQQQQQQRKKQKQEQKGSQAGGQAQMAARALQGIISTPGGLMMVPMPMPMPMPITGTQSVGSKGRGRGRGRRRR